MGQGQTRIENGQNNVGIGNPNPYPNSILFVNNSILAEFYLRLCPQYNWVEQKQRAVHFRNNGVPFRQIGPGWNSENPIPWPQQTGHEPEERQSLVEFLRRLAEARRRRAEARRRRAEARRRFQELMRLWQI